MSEYQDTPGHPNEVERNREALPENREPKSVTKITEKYKQKRQKAVRKQQEREYMNVLEVLDMKFELIPNWIEIAASRGEEVLNLYNLKDEVLQVYHPKCKNCHHGDNPNINLVDLCKEYQHDDKVEFQIPNDQLTSVKEVNRWTEFVRIIHNKVIEIVNIQFADVTVATTLSRQGSFQIKLTWGSGRSMLNKLFTRHIFTISK